MVLIMENNRFYQNRKQIQKLCNERTVDVDVGSTMFAKEHGWKNWESEMDEWKALQRKYIQSKDKTLADLFK